MTLNADEKSLNEALQSANKLKELHAALNAHKAVLLAGAKKLNERITELRRMPLLRSEVLQVILKEIDRVGATFPAQAKWGAVFGDFAFPKGSRPSAELEFKHSSRTPGPLSLSDLDVGAGPIFNHENVGDFVSGAFGAKVEDEARFYFFFGDIIKAKVKANFESLCPPLEHSGAAERDGITLAMKREEIATIQKKLEIVNAEIKECTAQIAQIEEASVQKPLLHPYR